LLHVERSNRTERLFEGLATRLMAPGRNPLTTATVVVQGPGMERWLAQSLAQEHGVCANTEFVFPRVFLERLFGTPLEEIQSAPWSPGRLTWEIARILEASGDDPDFAPLSLHLDASDGDWRRVQLAAQIARLFDRYATFRPEWLIDWGEAEGLPEERDARWQARLVRTLTDRLGPDHFAGRAKAFLERVKREDAAAVIEERAPNGVEIFAVSTLAPLVLSVVDALAQHTEVHLSILSPSRAWWADLRHEVRDAELREPTEGEGLFDAPNPGPVARLLANLGRLGGDFQRSLEDVSGVHDAEAESYAEPEGDRLLDRLQRAILDLDDVPEGERVIPADDDSIRVHLCHGPRRELEVLQATLREAFERDPTLEPEDVIVMAPAIDALAPDIEAIFGARQDDGTRIPHRIADRGALRRSLVADAFVALLSLVTSRGGREEVLDWLVRAPARQRFGLDEESVERIAEWAVEAGIRFGFDGDHRGALDLEAADVHTWSGGLTRLAFAHAVGGGEATHEGFAPAPLPPMLEPDVLGALGDLTDLLDRARRRAARPQPVVGWCDWLAQLLGQACEQTDDDAHEHLAIRRLLTRLADGAREAGFDTAVPFEAIREQVVDALTTNPAPQAFLAGGVTFCELVPLRAIPFRVVAILGLADGAFPRGGPASGFDLAARQPRAGDRDPRSDDRYLFLEAILSARERLILSVPGRDLRDGSDLPPSIVVSELLECLDDAFEDEERQSIAERLVVAHALQPFSPTCFDASSSRHLPGADREAFAAAEARRAAANEGGGSPRVFLSDQAIDAANAENSPGMRVDPTLDLDALIGRLNRASRFFVRDRLQLRLPREEDVVPEFDPTEPAGLDRFKVGQAMLRAIEAGDTALERLAAAPILPRGVPGDAALRKLRAEAVAIARVAAKRREGEARPDLEDVLTLDVDGLGAVRLAGRVDALYESGRVVCDFRKIGGTSELDAWIRHLFLCACTPAGVVPKTILVGRPEDSKGNRVAVFDRVKDSEAQLARLYAWAASADRAPLPFLPDTSRAFAEKIESDPEAAWRNANKKFHGSGGGVSWSTPEVERELETVRLWEGRSPVSPSPIVPGGTSFDSLATAIFGPLLAARSVDHT